MNDNIWNANIKALKQFHPELKWVLDGDVNKYMLEEQLENIEIENAYTEELITVVTAKGKQYYLSGKYSPVGMAHRVAERYKDVAYKSVMFVVGFSDGRIIRRLIECIEEDVIFVIYEPSCSIFLHTLHHYDCCQAFQTKNINWIIGGDNEYVLEQVLSVLLTVDNMLNVKVIVQGNYDRIFYPEVKMAVSILNKCIKKLRVRWNTNMVFSNELVENVIKNAKYMYRHYAVDSLYHTLESNVPVIIVAAGPSLDKNIDELKAAKRKACILACDTALKPLLRHDIVPDFFFIVDPAKPIELFDDERVWKIPMVAGLTIPANIMQKHKGEKILCLDNYLVVDMLRHMFGDKINDPQHVMSDLPTGGSVATTAFSAARLMGAQTIILVGQDLAFSAEKEHADGTFQNDRRTADIKSDIYVEDIHGNMVKTRGDFKLYLDWYEDELKKYPDLNVIDATEGGAKISGTNVCTLHESIQEYCNSSFKVDDYLKRLSRHFNEKEQKEALDYIHSIPDRFKKIEEKLTTGERYYKKLEQLVSKKNYKYDDLQKILKKIKSVNIFIEKEYLTDLIMDGAKQEEFLIRSNIYRFEEDEQKNLLESAKMGLQLMKKMKEVLKRMWPDVEELGEFNGVYE